MPDLKLHDFSNPAPFLRLPFGLPAQVLALCFVGCLFTCLTATVLAMRRQHISPRMSMAPIGSGSNRSLLWVSVVLVRNPTHVPPAHRRPVPAAQIRRPARPSCIVDLDHLKLIQGTAGMVKNGAEKLELLCAGTDCAANALQRACCIRCQMLRTTERST